MVKLAVIILIAAAPLLLQAQAGKQLSWYNVSQFGWLMGDNQHTWSIETINGVGYKKYSAGVGVALDKYGYKSIPVFADLRYNLATTHRTALQVYGDAGVNLPLRSDYLPYKYNNSQVWHTLHPSFYGEAGISYKIALIHKFSLIAGAGYNYKTFKYTEIIYTGDVSTPSIGTDYTYHYSKYVLRIGFGF